MLEGVPVSTGVAIGRVRIRGYELEQNGPRLLARTETEREVERFRRAVARSKAQVDRLQADLSGELGKEEAKILGVHLAYLEDPTFLADVEDRITKKLMPLETALAAVVRDFDRIFELVENERLKECALDLRDVALRVLRNLGDGEDVPQPEMPAGEEPYILATHKLSITDMFHLDRERVLGIVAESGGPNSHAAILARSIGIPAVTGIKDLRTKLADGDFVILDATAGTVFLNPDERLRREYESRAVESRRRSPFEDEGPNEMGDGSAVRLLAAGGNLGDVGQALEVGLDGVGLYRTELLFIAGDHLPGEELLAKHYGEVLGRAAGKPVTFRLLDLSGDMRLPGFPRRLEPNPALGLKGVRFLLREPTLFRTQVRALLRAAAGSVLEAAVPFVTTAQDLSRVRSAFVEEAELLRKGKTPCAERIRLGAVVEVPAAAVSLEPIAAEADFLVVAIDDLQQYLLAADRDNLHVAEYFRVFHPALFRMLAELVQSAGAAGRECRLFGEAAADPLRLPFYLGIGFRSFAVSPVRAPRVRKTLREWTSVAAEALAREVLAAPSSLEVQRLLLQAER